MWSGSLNLSYKVEDNPVLVLKNRTRVSEALGKLPEKFIIHAQTHSNNCLVVTHNTKQEELENTDAVITAEKGLMIAVMLILLLIFSWSSYF
jgi:copper oxidase (laccase) domain-containing protein